MNIYLRLVGDISDVTFFWITGRLVDDETNGTCLFLLVIVLPFATKNHHHQSQVYVYTALKFNFEKKASKRKGYDHLPSLKGYKC